MCLYHHQHYCYYKDVDRWCKYQLNMGAGVYGQVDHQPSIIITSGPKSTVLMALWLWLCWFWIVTNVVYDALVILDKTFCAFLITHISTEAHFRLIKSVLEKKKYCLYCLPCDFKWSLFWPSSHCYFKPGNEIIEGLYPLPSPLFDVTWLPSFFSIKEHFPSHAICGSIF